MPQQPIENVENNFTGGLKTEFTGLNFPENAATDTDNCIYNLTGNVSRRLGIDLETSPSRMTINRNDKAITTYKWDNAGGDGETQIVVEQIGDQLFFYRSSSVTSGTSLSSNKLASVINLEDHRGTGITASISEYECQFTDGNGYLFVFHPHCALFYCTYSAGVIENTEFGLKIRDFLGIPEGTPPDLRPASLSVSHEYNLTNQGWVKGSAWAASSSSSFTVSTGTRTFTVQSGLVGVTNGQAIKVISTSSTKFPPAGTYLMSGTVTSYSGTTLQLNITSVNGDYSGQSLSVSTSISPTNTGYIDAWNTAVGNYPSNSDVWWRYKNTSGAFDPATTIDNITISSGNATKGHYIIDALRQDRSIISGISGLTSIVAYKRPSIGTWFQGRVWYSGVDTSSQASGTAPYYTWTENIYFSQVISDATNFGDCYQVNDPTSEDLFDLLPTDGGVIVIQGAGRIYRLFPIQNGLLVFAANGVWFITGSRGIGFAANDYTVVKISEVRSLSSNSFVNVQGLPYFWNEEGIYTVQPQQGGGLSVTPVTLDTILSFYSNIPTSSKKYVKGAYDPINYIIQWTYRSTTETSITERYNYDRILILNVYNKSFYPYTIDTSLANINGIVYVSNPGGSTNAPEPTFKYVYSQPITSLNSWMAFSDERDEDYLDYKSVDGVGVDYNSYLVTGYKLHGKGQRRFQVGYIYIYSNAEDPTSYKIQGIWDYANSGNSGRWSTVQLVTNALSRFSKIFRRHKIRGRGLVLQFKISSVTGMPFSIDGWSVQEQLNAGV